MKFIKKIIGILYIETIRKPAMAYTSWQNIKDEADKYPEIVKRFNGHYGSKLAWNIWCFLKFNSFLNGIFGWYFINTLEEAARDE